MIERIIGENVYGVKVTVQGKQYGEVCAHTEFTHKHPEIVERYLDRMEKELQEQMAEKGIMV